MVVTLPFVAGKTKKLDRKYVEHLRSILLPIVKDRFDDNQTAAAKAMRVSQPQLNAVLRGDASRAVGIVFLLAIRDYLRNYSLDELLGLEPPSVSVDLVESAMQRVLDRNRHFSAGKDAPLLLPPAGDVARPRKRRDER